MTSNHHAPYVQGYTRATMADTKGSEERSGANPKKSVPVRIEAETRPHEAGVASNRESACRGECVPGSCTHRPSHHGSWKHPKPAIQPSGRKSSKVKPMTGVKS
jgi:hypothetical protein